VRTVTVAGRTTVMGDELVQLLHRLIGYGKYIQVVERRGYPRDIVEKLLAREVRDKSLFADRRQLEVFAETIAARGRTIGIVADEEHNLFQLHIEDRASGYPRRHTLTADAYVQSFEARRNAIGVLGTESFAPPPVRAPLSPARPGADTAGNRLIPAQRRQTGSLNGGS